MIPMAKLVMFTSEKFKLTDSTPSVDLMHDAGIPSTVSFHLDIKIVTAELDQASAFSSRQRLRCSEKSS